jgi:hypothetical protein
MKSVIPLVAMACLGVICAAQTSPTKYIVLSPKSNITTAQVAEGFAKSCPNVVVTENADKAQYVLEAGETQHASDGTTYSRWHFTLMNKDGDVLMTTHPEVHFGHKYKHHFDALCKYINKQ